MIKKLSQREKRTVKIGAVCVAAILVFTFGSRWLDHWLGVRSSLGQMKAKLDDINMSDPKRAGLLSIVPVFEMPQIEETQKFLFMEKFNEQLKRAGINSEPLQVLPARKSTQPGYKLLCLKCKGKCKFEQVLNLLANLKDNPYLVGIEEIRMKCDPNKREEFELDLVVSTFVK
jgi:hypothetical protein